MSAFLTSSHRISVCSCLWKSRNLSTVSFLSRVGPKKKVLRALFMGLRVLPVTAWSLWRIPMLVWERITSRTYKNIHHKQSKQRPSHIWGSINIWYLWMRLDISKGLLNFAAQLGPPILFNMLFSILTDNFRTPPTHRDISNGII